MASCCFTQKKKKIPQTGRAWGAQTSLCVLGMTADGSVGLRRSASHSCLVWHPVVVPNHTVLQVMYLETVCQEVPSSSVQRAEIHCVASYQAFAIGAGSCMPDG